MTPSVDEVVASALGEGREVLLETEAYRVAEALGIGVPRHLVLPTAGAATRRALEPLPGDRLVVKVLSPGVLHKSDLGGVRIVPREVVSDALGEMARAFDGAEIRGFLVVEYVPHLPGGEVLLAVRRTPEFGPVLAVGLGGTQAEMLSSALPPCLFPVPVDPTGMRRALARAGAVGFLTSPGREGRVPVDGTALDEFLRRFVAAAGDLPAQVVEFEVNPLVFTAGGPVALDALARLGKGADAVPPRPLGQIERLLHPESIAVVGVSERMNPGRVILRNVLAAGFPAHRVTVVKPGSPEIDGCRCVPDLASLPGPVDLLVLSIAAAAVPGALEEICHGGVAASVIVIPGGLGERSGSEALAERARAAIGEGRRRGSGAIVNGGNSMGIRSIPGRYDATFIPGHKSSGRHDAEMSPLAVVSQSGAFAIARLDRLARLRPRYLITVGNQIDLTVGDYLEHLAGDPRVEVIACYVEGFRPGDGRRFLEAARRLTGRFGAVVAYLAGRTPEGAASAASHTASIAPDHTVARALAEQAGVLVAGTLEEFEDLVRLAVLLPRRRVDGMELAAVSNAGFEAVAMADNLGPFSLAHLGPDTVSRIETVLQRHRIEGVVGVGNPLDLTPIAGDAGFAEAVTALLADDGVDVGIVGCVPLTPSLATLEAAREHGEDVAAPGSLASRLIALWRATTKAWVVVVDGGTLYDAMADLLEGAGVPVFRTADRATAALGRYAAWRARA
jgi:acyl-CoA synthetase (NDP forming)